MFFKNKKTRLGSNREYRDLLLAKQTRREQQLHQSISPSGLHRFFVAIKKIMPKPKRRARILQSTHLHQRITFASLQHKKTQKFTLLRPSTYTRFAHLYASQTRGWKFALPMIALSLFGSGIYFSTLVSGATYTWTQTQWSTLTSNTTGHPTPSNWTEYSAKDSGIAVGSEVTLASQNSSFVKTADTDFSGGTFSNTAVTGTGASASIGIAPVSTPVNTWATVLPTVPGTVSNGAQMIRNGTEDLMYVLRGGNTNGFYKYSISGNLWSTLTVTPTAINAGSQILRNGADNDIYVLQGNTLTGFYKYSISDNSWTTLTVAPGAIYDGSQMIRNGSDNDIYVLQGNTLTGFYKYSISGNSWTTLTVAPGTMNTGSKMIRNATDNDIYVLRGNSVNLYKYSISGNSWTTLTSASFTASTGSQMIRNATDNDIYVLSGGITTGFYKYSISGNSWTTLTVAPSFVGVGSQLIRNGADNDIYYINGNSSTVFAKYSISGNSWTSLTAVPNAIYSGAQMIRNSADNDIYILSGGGGNGFHKYSISGNSWISTTQTTLTASAAALFDGDQMIRNGSDNDIYTLRGGGGLTFAKYSISGNSWTTLASAPGGIGIGSQMIRNGSDNDIYVLQGNSSTGLYKYSISGNSWTTLTAAPAIVGVGSQILRNGSDNDIYVLKGNTSQTFYKYSISGNSWTTLAGLATNATTGSQMIRNGSDNDIYMMSGSSTSLARYSISGNAWTALTPAPVATGAGSQMIRNGASNDIYMVQGGGYFGFYKYSISGNSWTALTGNLSGAGTQVVLNSADNEFYYLSASNSSTFAKYSMTNNTWTTLNQLPVVANNGAKMIRNGSDNEVYVLPSNGSTTLQKFTINNVTYTAPGTYTSPVIDMSSAINLTTAAYTTTLSSQTLTMDIGAGDTLVPDGTWTWLTSVASGADISSLSGKRYVQYIAHLSTANTSVTPLLNDATVNFNTYLTNQTLTSSAFNSVATANILGDVVWDETIPSNTSLSVFIRAADTSVNLASAAWSPAISSATTGCSKSSITVTCLGTAVAELAPYRTGSGSQWFQYKTILNSVTGATAPSLSNISMKYVVNAPPEIQNVMAIQNSDGIVSLSYDVRDIDTTTGTSTPNVITPTFQYWNGSSWVSMTTLLSGATNQSVNESTFETHTATWNAPVDFANQYFANTVKVRVTANDNEGANNTTSADSTPFIFDTKTPTGNTASVDATVEPALLSFTSSDDTALQMMISLQSDFSGAVWESYAATKTIALESNPDTVYVKFKDAYGNVTTTLNAITPEMANGLMIQDTSNMAVISEYRLFTAWKTIANPVAGFDRYEIFRADETGPFSLIDTVSSRLTNYYGDNTVIGDTIYRYRVVAVDAAENKSYLSSIVTGKANGIQDSGEGGGGTETTAPIISNVSVSNVFTTQATFTWDTDELSFSTLGHSATSSIFTTETGVADLANNAGGVGNHQVTLTGLTPNTTYYVRVKSTDAVGNFATDDNGGNGYSFTTLPGPAITGVALQGASNTTATVTWNTNTPATTKIEYADAVVNGALVNSNEIGTTALKTGHSQKITGLTAGTNYYFAVYSTDGSSNEAINNNGGNFYQFTTTSDVTAPSISSIDTPLTTHDGAVMTWTTDEIATSQVKYSLTSGGPYSFTAISTEYNIGHSVILSGLTADTTYYYQVISEDASANTTTSSETSFTTSLDPSFVHSALSTISNISTPPTILTDIEAVTSFETDQDAQCSIGYGTSTGNYPNTIALESTYTRLHALHFSGLNTETQYFYQIHCVDNLANTIDSTEKTFTTKVAQQDVPVVVVDTTAPVISSITTPLKTNDSTLIAWVTDEAATSQVKYSLTSGGPYITLDATMTYDVSHAVILSSLTANTKYYYKIISQDLSGNTVTSNEENFTTSIDPSLNHPALSVISTISDPPTFLTDQKAVITFKTDQSALCYIQYGATAGQYDETPVSETLYNQEHALHIPGLTLSTPYFYQINCMDNAYHVVVSDEKTFTTMEKQVTAGSEAGDIVAPNISNVSVSNITGETAVVTWNTDENANSYVRYGLTNEFGKMAGDDIVNTDTTKYDTKHTVTITDLIPGKTKYFFTVLSSDIAGNVGQSGESTFATKDTTAISSIRSFSQKIGEVTIAWKTSNKTTSLVEYGLTQSYSDKKESNSVSNDHELTLSGLTANTTYHFRVRGVDALKNAFASDDLTFEPKSPPTISNVAIETLSEREAKVTFNSNVPTDALIVFQGIDSSKESGSQGDPTLTQTHSIILKNLRPGTKYRATIKAQDETGNASQNSEKTFETKSDDTAPVINQIRTDVALTQNNKVQTLISWTTDELATSAILYREGQYGEEKELTVNKDLSQNHISVITSFKPGNVYYFRVKVRDDFGNEFLSKDYMALTPKRTENIVEVIVGNFKDIFSWAK